MNTTMTAGKGDFKPALWTPGDWNAFFGFGTNILVNMLVLTGLLRFVLKMPDDIVFHRILPATGLMLFLSTATPATPPDRAGPPDRVDRCVGQAQAQSYALLPQRTYAVDSCDPDGQSGLLRCRRSARGVDVETLH